MQGVIFTAFADMIIEQQGMELWNDLLAETSPASGGSYTSGYSYDDSELLNMVALLSEKTGLSVAALQQAFGEFLFPRLMVNSPVAVSKANNLREFLLLIDTVIHTEVKRVHPNAYLPTFDYDESKPEQLTMFYQSKRQLCALAEGLILGAAKYFKETVSLAHPDCCHRGAERCRIIVSFGQ